MDETYTTLSMTRSLDVSVSAARAQGDRALLDVEVALLDAQGAQLGRRGYSGVEVVPVSDGDAVAYLTSGPCRERLGSVGAPDDGMEERLATLLLARDAGVDASGRASEDPLALEDLALAASRCCSLGRRPEEIAATETLLWDDSWYDDPEAFAADFEELGGDPCDEEALAAFVEDRLAEDFGAFLAAAEPALEDAAALMVHATTPAVDPFDPHSGLPRSFEEAMTGTLMAHELAACSRVVVSDVRGSLRVGGFSPSGREVSYELRRLTPEQLRMAEDVCQGRERESSLSAIWARAREPRIASQVLEDRSRAVVRENPALCAQRDERLASEPDRDETALEADR